MNNETFIVGVPDNPVLRQIAQDMLEELRAAALKAMAHIADPGKYPLPTDPQAIEHLYLAHFRAKPADRHQNAAARALAGAGSGTGMSLDLRSPVSAPAQLRAKRAPRNFILKDLQKETGSISAAPDTIRRGLTAGTAEVGPRAGGAELAKAIQSGLKLPGLAGNQLAGLKNLDVGKHLNTVLVAPPKPKPKIKLNLPGPYSAVALRLHRMFCIEETDGPGSDEIQLAGIATAPNGSTRKISPITVSNDFDSGEFREFGLEFNLGKVPPLVDHGPTTFARFKYADDIVQVPNKGPAMVGWPRTYTVTFLLSEIDNGGFPAFIQEIYERVKGEATKAIAAAVGALVGGVAGSVIPGIGNLAGAAVGALVGYIIGELWELFIQWWEDDVFVPITVATTRIHQFHRYVNNTSDDSANKTVWWKGHGGHYKLEFDWLVLA
jgi:hypothetical protein